MSDIPMEAAPVAEKAPDAPVRVLSEGLASLRSASVFSRSP